MAVRILDRYAQTQTVTDKDKDNKSDTDVDATIAVFIAFKTECVTSPMTHHTLVRLTGLSWQHLQALEAKILCSIKWRLYEGALI